MRITQRLEAEILQTLRDEPKTCITFPAEAYRPDGSIMIHRQNRSFRLHRYLSAQLGAPVPRGLYLHPACKTTGCMNPLHREVSRRSSVGRNASKCINGHTYTAATTLPSGRYRCRICRDERNARRRTGTHGGGYCGRGLHRLTPANTYTTTDVSGRAHRRCRICTIENMRARRAERSNDDRSGQRRQGPPREDQHANQRAGGVVPVHGRSAPRAHATAGAEASFDSLSVG